MATGTITLTIGSAAGFQQVGGGSSPSPYTGPFPAIQTVYTLNGQVIPFVEPPRAVIYVSTVSDYVFSPGTSAYKGIKIENLGNIPLTITNILFTSRGVSPVYSRTYPWTINPNQIGTLNLAYQAPSVGNFVNWLTIQSNNYNYDYRVITKQIVDNNYLIQLFPPTSITTITNYGGYKDVELNLVIFKNDILTSDLGYSISTSTTLGVGWSVLPSTSPTKINLRYETVDFVTTQTTAQASVTVNTFFSDGKNSVNTATLTGVVNIDPNKFKSYGSIVTPIAPYNSVIGISYDLIDGIKHVTLAVGSGGDNTQMIGDTSRGGMLSIEGSNLGYLSGADARRTLSFFSWAEVWRFPLGTSRETLLSGTRNDLGNFLYKTKSDNPIAPTTGIDWYFGSESSEGSMFILEHDGRGSVEIYINQVREYPTNNYPLQQTLENLSRAFYYYSNVDKPYRLSGPNFVSSSTYNNFTNYENQTYVFKGLSYNTETDTISVMNYLSPFPT